MVVVLRRRCGRVVGNFEEYLFVFVTLGVVDQADVTAPVHRSDGGTHLKGHVVVTARTLDL